MSYLPGLPGVPPPMSYGQGYGNWQQYAGFDKSNPMGGNENPMQKQPSMGVAPNAQIEDKSFSPPVPTSTFGVPSGNSMGMPSDSSMGAPMEILDVITHLTGG